MKKRQLIKVIENLYLERPYFHSEFDFQFELAMKLKEEPNSTAIRLEIPLAAKQSRYELDIMLHSNGEKIGIELKYATSELKSIYNGENFNIKAHQNNGARFDFLKDVYRLEQLKEAQKIVRGYAVFLTNVEKFYSGREIENRYVPIDLFEKRKIGPNETVNFLYNEKNADSRSIDLANEYKIKWRDYGKSGNFKYLLLEI